MDAKLGDGGYVLSAGQEQLVAFARIVVRDPRVVILDEATARMDPVTEGQVQRAAERLIRGRIGIVIAHRLSSVRRCDEVVVLADGEVIEAGPLRESQRFAQLAGQWRRRASGGRHLGPSPAGGGVRGHAGRRLGRAVGRCRAGATAGATAPQPRERDGQPVRRRRPVDGSAQG